MPRITTDTTPDNEQPQRVKHPDLSSAPPPPGTLHMGISVSVSDTQTHPVEISHLAELPSPEAEEDHTDSMDRKASSAMAEWESQLTLFDPIEIQPSQVPITIQQSGVGFTNDDPTSKSYRWRDTGYVAGSRKEHAISQIRLAAKEGRRVRASEIDWETIEQNPRTAASLITKVNLFGDTDWVALRDHGVDPGAAYIISKVYAAVGREPDEDNPNARRDYAMGLECLRDRLEAKADLSGVLAVLDEIRQELGGNQMTPEQTETHQELRDRYDAASTAYRTYRATIDEASEPRIIVEGQLNQATYEQSKRVNRKWKRDPELDAKIAELKPRVEALTAAWEAALEREKWTSESAGGYKTKRHPVEIARDAAYKVLDAYEKDIRHLNLVENPVTRGWLRLGEGFIRAIHYRSYKGSEAFAQHIATAKAGKITDWSWAETATGQKTVTKGETRFKLLTAETFDRRGGRTISIQASNSLKELFGLREVQSGKWVLDEPESAKWHMTACAEALADLADFLKVHDAAMSLRGNLALAFGARGRGARTGSAHYEPDERVINLTKLSGGGCLAHEWFHALDNMAHELVTGQVGRSVHHATEILDFIPGPVGDAFRTLHHALTQGTARLWEDLPYTKAEEKNAVYNLQEDGRASRTISVITSATDAGMAYDRLIALYNQGQFGSDIARKSTNRLNSWLHVSAIWHGRNDTMVTKMPKSAPISNYLKEAVRLDNGNIGKYWSTSHELAARAFAQYVQKGIERQGNQSDYLAAMNDNSYYTIFGMKPFPEDDERHRIELALDRLFEVLRQDGFLNRS